MSAHKEYSDLVERFLAMHTLCGVPLNADADEWRALYGILRPGNIRWPTEDTEVIANFLEALRMTLSCRKDTNAAAAARDTLDTLEHIRGKRVITVSDCERELGNLRATAYNHFIRDDVDLCGMQPALDANAVEWHELYESLQPENVHWPTPDPVAIGRFLEETRARLNTKWDTDAAHEIRTTLAFLEQAYNTQQLTVDDCRCRIYLLRATAREQVEQNNAMLRDGIRLLLTREEIRGVLSIHTIKLVANAVAAIMRAQQADFIARWAVRPFPRADAEPDEFLVADAIMDAICHCISGHVGRGQSTRILAADSLDMEIPPGYTEVMRPWDFVRCCLLILQSDIDTRVTTDTRSNHITKAMQTIALMHTTMYERDVPTLGNVVRVLCALMDTHGDLIKAAIAAVGTTAQPPPPQPPPPPPARKSSWLPWL